MANDQQLADANRMLNSAGAELYTLQNENERLRTEIERLQAAKRGALAIADERAKESVELRAENERLRAAFHWTLGEAPDADGKWFGDSKPETENGTPPRPYWWRTHLRALCSSQQSEDRK